MKIKYNVGENSSIVGMKWKFQQRRWLIALLQMPSVKTKPGRERPKFYPMPKLRKYRLFRICGVTILFASSNPSPSIALQICIVE